MKTLGGCGREKRKGKIKVFEGRVSMVHFRDRWR